MIDLDALLVALASRRPVFHSEADFQHALAWAIHEADAEMDIRLEYRAPYAQERVHLDLVMRKGGWTGVIELKYKTKPLQTEIIGEGFDLQDHGAEPLGRYDFLKDLERVEEAVAKLPDATGWAVMLTNDSQYWNPESSAGVTDAAFRIHHGRELQPGQLAWRLGAENGVAKGRERPLNIRGSYRFAWNEYSMSPSGARCRFRSLVLKAMPVRELTATVEQPLADQGEATTQMPCQEVRADVTAAEAVYLAASGLVRRGQTIFSRQDLVRELGDSKAAYRPTFDPTFQGMRTDPGQAPKPAPRFRGLLERVSRGEYRLSEAGLRMMAADAAGIVSGSSRSHP